MARPPTGDVPIILPGCKILDSDEYSTWVNGDGGWRKGGHGGGVVEDNEKNSEYGEEAVEGKCDHCRENTKGRELAGERREWENAGENAKGWRSPRVQGDHLREEDAMIEGGRGGDRANPTQLRQVVGPTRPSK